MDHLHTVGGEPDVELDADAGVDGALQRRQRVLGGSRAVQPTVRERNREQLVDLRGVGRNGRHGQA